MRSLRVDRSFCVLLFASLLLLLPVAPFPLLTPVAAQQWVTTEYEYCSERLYGEAYASLHVDVSHETNFMDSREWISNTAQVGQVYVKGTGTACFTGDSVLSTLLPLQRCIDEIGNRQPLRLYQCRPTVTSWLSYFYMGVGIPTVLLFLLYLHWNHKRMLGLDRFPCPGDRMYGMWFLLFSQGTKQADWAPALESELAEMSDSGKQVTLRWLEVTHSLFCFFFISPIDTFHWRSRLICFVFEQGIAFSANAIFATHLPDQGSETKNAGAIIFLSVVTVVVLTVLLPIRHLVRKLKRKKEGGCSNLGSKLWLALSIVIVIVGVCMVLVYTGISGGKDIGANAPNQGPGLLFFSFKSYLAAMPYQFLVEILKVVVLLRIEWKSDVQILNKYTMQFCVRHDRNPRKLRLGKKMLAQRQEQEMQHQRFIQQQKEHNNSITPFQQQGQTNQPPQNHTIHIQNAQMAHTQNSSGSWQQHSPSPSPSPPAFHTPVYGSPSPAPSPSHSPPMFASNQIHPFPVQAQPGYGQQAASPAMVSAYIPGSNPAHSPLHTYGMPVGATNVHMYAGQHRG